MNAKLLIRLVGFIVLSTIGSGYAIAAPILEQVSPSPTSYIFDTDFTYMDQSVVADVTASVEAIDLDLGLGNSSTSGCEAADFTGFSVGSIALIQRGACTFQAKAENAALAGAVGVLIFNQGNTVLREGLLIGTLGPLYTGGIPVLGLTYGLGSSFAAITGLEVRMFVDQSVRPGAVPEPSILALFAAGLLGLGFTRRKKHN